MTIPEQVLELIRIHSLAETPPGIAALAAAARERHGPSVRAVLLYGSMLRSGNVHDGLADLYLLVEDYRSAFNSRTLAMLNALLPPNVFYLEIPFQGHTLRAKYAVLTVDDFLQGTKRWFHSYLWGRFAQKAALLYACDERVAREVQQALAMAAMTLVARTLPQMTSAFTPRELWSRGLALSYRAELRTEHAEGAVRLFDADPAYYQSLTGALFETSSLAEKVIPTLTPHLYQVRIPLQTRRLNRAAWRLRTLQGKCLSALRLLKGLGTFNGGIDYILWKIERHSGVRVDVGPQLKKLPPVAIVVVFWRLYRRNAFR